MSQYKRCSRCRSILSIDLFGSHRRYSDGKQTSCFICTTEYRLEWKVKKLLIDPDYFNRSARELTARNPEKVRENKRNWRANNLEAARKSARKYNANNSEKVYLNGVKFAASNREKLIAQKHRRRERVYAGGSFLVTKKDLARIYAQRCLACNSFDRIEADHVMPLSRGGVNSIGNLIPLCITCNRSKGTKTFMEWRLFRIRDNRPLPIERNLNVSRLDG